LLRSLPPSGLGGGGLDIAKRERNRPVGGRIKHFLQNWRILTRDPWILETVSGYQLELRGSPSQELRPPRPVLDTEKDKALDIELEKLKVKRAITPVHNETGSFLSPMFLVPKADGSWRPVINLRSLNQFVVARHFKMEGIRVVKGLMRLNDWMVKLDLKDAYLSVPMSEQHRKFLRFEWHQQTWEFSCLPFGLSSAPYTFTKLLKPAVALLRKLGVRCILYLDDMLIMAQSKQTLLQQLATAIDQLVSLGFIINLDKSVVEPAHTIEFLGFLLNSTTMTIALPSRKVHQIQQSARKMLKTTQITTRSLAQLLGLMVAAHPAVLPAPLYYRQLEKQKIRQVQSHGYDSKMSLTFHMKSDLTWWITHLKQHNGRNLQISQWDLVIESDASMRGWGASCGETSTGGRWTRNESRNHINFLELLAAFLALKTFVPNLRPNRVLLRLDNVTAISFINRMGGTHSTTLSDLAVEMWKWCLQKGVIIHAEHLPGTENIRADWESRHVRDSSDWKLQREIFLQLERRCGPFTIDLFASRTNAQMQIYCSWKPDPHAVAVDALSISWRNHRPYMFPPFSLITRCLEKIDQEEVDAILIAPVWQSQVWFPRILESLMDDPILLPEIHNIVTDIDSNAHPLACQGHLPLAAWPISGRHSAQEAYRRELSQSSTNHGEVQQNQPTVQHGASGLIGVVNGAYIPFQLL
jgi:hypothetical protein